MSENSHDGDSGTGSSPAGDPVSGPDEDPHAAPLAVLIASWAVPHRLRHAARRFVLALAAPATVVVTFVAFMALVDWP
ncbi:hypothetical protein [Streptomyces sp. NPDC055886]